MTVNNKNLTYARIIPLMQIISLLAGIPLIDLFETIFLLGIFLVWQACLYESVFF